MTVNMKLEDQYNDVLKKFRYGRKVGLRALSDTTGIPMDSLRGMEAGTVIPSADEWASLGTSMGFNGNVMERLHFAPERTPCLSLPSSVLPVREDYFGYAVWTYLVFHPGSPKRALLVDTGGLGETICQTIEKMDLELDAVLLTHGHSDHAGDLSRLGSQLPAKIFLHKADFSLLPSPLPSAIRFQRPEEAGDQLSSLGWKIGTQKATGHTSGSVAYLIHDVLFVGDAIFAGSSGKAENPDAFQNSLLSVQHLLTLNNPSTFIVSGHGPFTTVGMEREWNPFFNANPIMNA